MNIGIIEIRRRKNNVIIAVKLDLDFIEALDSAEKVYNIDKAREE